MRVGAVTQRKDTNNIRMTKSERLNKVFGYLSYNHGIKSKKKFANQIGFNYNNIISAFNGDEKYLTDSLFESIALSFPMFSKEWLLKDKGDMLVDDKLNVKIDIDAEAGDGGAASAIGDASVGMNLKEREELIALRVENKELKKNLSNAKKEHEELIQLRVENAGLKSQITAKDALIAELQKMNNFLMEKK